MIDAMAVLHWGAGNLNLASKIASIAASFEFPFLPSGISGSL